MENPYQSPESLQPTTAPTRNQRRGRSLKRAGLLVLFLAVVLYGPMTVGPVLSIFVLRQQHPLAMVGASLFNGTIFSLLLWLGVWLRRKGREIENRADSKPNG
jgi:hypothetical protein